MAIISCIIADDHEIFRQGIRNVLNRDHKLKCIGEAENGLALLQLLQQHKPDVILLDMKMPEMDGVQATAKIKELYPTTKILVLTMYDEEEMILHMLDMGVNGYLVKTASPAEILRAIHKVYEDDFYLSDLVGKLMLKSRQQKNDIPLSHKKNVVLNDKEKEILRLMCKELTTTEIGTAIHLSPRTVEGIRSTLIDKLEVRNSTGLIIYAVKNGIADA